MVAKSRENFAAAQTVGMRSILFQKKTARGWKPTERERRLILLDLILMRVDGEFGRWGGVTAGIHTNTVLITGCIGGVNWFSGKVLTWREANSLIEDWNRRKNGKNSNGG